uniref:Uncharacterized protein LOC105035189 isoform X3 n=1 Tax=Elaeis guineensis var. tenera TaxID=51953 RepID=A0A6I9QGQ6_ELAGV|nr:uncharacterized protein LOC105035189 isoform X3 [Elaeis guineensis]
MKTKERHKKIERCRYKVNETRLVVIYKRWDTLQDREALHRSKQEWILMPLVIMTRHRHKITHLLQITMLLHPAWWQLLKISRRNHLQLPSMDIEHK